MIVYTTLDCRPITFIVKEKEERTMASPENVILVHEISKLKTKEELWNPYEWYRLMRIITQFIMMKSRMYGMFFI